MSLRFRLLGAVEVEAGGSLLRLGAVKERALLALLTLHANEVVTRDVLIDRLWVRPPAGAVHALETHVSALRKALRAGCDRDVLLTKPGGYLLSVEPEQVDVRRFERLLGQGESALAAGDAEGAERLLSAALSCWRGSSALADIAFEPVALAEAGRLEELRLGALEARAEAQLVLGRHAEVVRELQPLLAQQPRRERLCAQLMLALYRTSRQADALAVYQEGRRRLVEELGIEPSRELQQLQLAILRHAPELDLPGDSGGTRPARLAPEPSAAAAPVFERQQRKLVTVVSCDASGSSALGERLDPEVLRPLLTGYIERIRLIVERHGGTVETFVGDVVTAMFGVPVVHEDDALRAVGAAIEIRAALTELGVGARIGVETGEVVTGTEGQLAIGDAVVIAARLQRAARSGEVLIGNRTLALVSGAVETKRVRQPAPKEEDEAVPAHRLLRVRELPERARHERFVGRRREFALLRGAWLRARAERRCELVTIVGEAGIGKSRLVAEFLQSLEARVVRGRCLPYGDGITYWPVVEALQQLRVVPPDPAAAEAIRSLLGESEARASAEEIAWAVRKTFEHAADRRPLVVVFDDIHRGENTFLDLVERIALLSSRTPILLLCMARPELAERRPAWPVALPIGPLSEDEVEQLLPDHISPELRTRIARAAGGNPLFIAEMLAIADETSVEVVVPPTLQALLAARLDQLESGERRVLEHGAVEGEVFHRGAVQALAPEETRVDPALAGLVRKQLIRPESPQLPGEDAFRFCHLLMRDAAYDALPKQTRAELHQRLAAWLDEHSAGLVELDQILGYHLDRALRYRGELGLPDDGELRAAARCYMAAAGRRVYARQDYAAAAGLLERAAALMSPNEIDVSLETELVDALLFGRNGREALRRAVAIAERAAATGDRVGELCGRIQQGFVRLWLEPEGATEQQAALVERALPLFEAAGDDYALCVAYRTLGLVANMRAQMDRMVEACEHAAVHAARAGLADWFVLWRHLGRLQGTTSASELLAWQDEQDERELRNPWARAFRAWATAMLGRIEEARSLLAELRAELAARGASLPLGGVTGQAGIAVELLAGDPAAAVAIGEESCRVLDELGQQTVLSTTAGWLAGAYYRLGRLEEADAWGGCAAELGASDDAITQMLWRQVLAKVLARRGEHAEAERLAHEAVAIGAETQMLNAQADAYADLAEVLSLDGRPQEANGALAQALTRYERKQNLVMAERVRAQLAELATLPASETPANQRPAASPARHTQDPTASAPSHPQRCAPREPPMSST